MKTLFITQRHSHYENYTPGMVLNTAYDNLPRIIFTIYIVKIGGSNSVVLFFNQYFVQKTLKNVTKREKLFLKITLAKTLQIVHIRSAMNPFVSGVDGFECNLYPLT